MCAFFHPFTFLVHTSSQDLNSIRCEGPVINIWQALKSVSTISDHSKSVQKQRKQLWCSDCTWKLLHEGDKTTNPSIYNYYSINKAKESTSLEVPCWKSCQIDWAAGGTQLHPGNTDNEAKDREIDFFCVSHGELSLLSPICLPPICSFINHSISLMGK